MFVTITAVVFVHWTCSLISI